MRLKGFCHRTYICKGYIRLLTNETLWKTCPEKCSTNTVPTTPFLSQFHQHCSESSIPPSLFNQHCSTQTIPPTLLHQDWCNSFSQTLFHQHSSILKIVSPTMILQDSSTNTQPQFPFHKDISIDTFPPTPIHQHHSTNTEPSVGD